jgi:FG-GAP repeat
VLVVSVVVLSGAQSAALGSRDVGASLGALRSVVTRVFRQAGVKLTGGGARGAAGFAYSVALSADGDTALIGGPADNRGVGAAWVFASTGSTWVQEGRKLTGRGEIGAGEFGWSVALSGDGNTALISGVSDNHNRGAAWVFTRSGAAWTQLGEKLTGGGETGAAEFGYSVALSSNGSTALVGGPFDRRPEGYPGNAGYGAAWVFTRTGATWSQEGRKLTGRGETAVGDFGDVVALSGNGDTALVGAFSVFNVHGAAWVFTRTGLAWTQQGNRLTGRGETGAGSFGWSVALSADGDTALIGGPNDNNDVGAAWVFTRTGSTWTQKGAKLIGDGEIGAAGFADSVALSANGDTALIGGWGDNKFRGAAWVFTGRGSVWTQQGAKLTGRGETGHDHDGNFASTVALSADGGTALIGGPGDNHNHGAAWVFAR